MARNFRELQEKMDPASRAGNRQRVRDELQRMALDELRSAKQLTQADMAEMLDVPQSSISRIERRADMYLSTLRNYIHAMGGSFRFRPFSPMAARLSLTGSATMRMRRTWSGLDPKAKAPTGYSRGRFNIRARRFPPSP